MRGCMGGWCTRRDRCAHYAERSNIDPVERMCVPGTDGLIKPPTTPIVITAYRWKRQNVFYAARSVFELGEAA